jgi:mutator protein MutT
MEKPHVEVTAAVIFREGNVLIAKRKEGTHLGGYWEFPGGKREPGEGLEACLEREVTEELGIRVKAERVLTRVDYDYGFKTIALHVFLCTWLDGDPETLGCQEVKWVHPRELHGYAFPPADEEVIRRISVLGGGLEPK